MPCPSGPASPTPRPDTGRTRTRKHLTPGSAVLAVAVLLWGHTQAQASADGTPGPGALHTMVKVTEQAGEDATSAPITFGLPMDPGGVVRGLSVGGEAAQVDGCTADLSGDTRWCRVTARVDLKAGTSAILTVRSRPGRPETDWRLAADGLPADSLPRVIVTDVNGDGARWTCDLAATQTTPIAGAFDYTAAHNPGWTWADGDILKAGANWSAPCLRNGDNTVHPDLRLHADVYAYARDAATVDYIEVDLRLENSFWQDADGWWRDTMTDVYAGIEIQDGSGASLYSAPSITSSADLTVAQSGEFAKHWLEPLVTIATTGSPFTFDHQGSMLISGSEHYTIVKYLDANTVWAMAHGAVTSGTITGNWTISGVRIPHSSRAVKTVVSYGKKPSITVRHHRDNLFAGGLFPAPGHESSWVAPRNADRVSIVNLSENDNLLPLAITLYEGSTNCVLAGWWPYALDRGECGNPEGYYLPLQHIEGLREVDADGFHPAGHDWDKLIFRTSRLFAASGKRTYRSKKTGRIVDVLNDSQVQRYQAGFPKPVAAELGPQPVYDLAHVNNQSYLPCLLSGRYWDCEDVQAQLAYYHQTALNQKMRPEGSQGAKLMWANCGQLRNCAWWDRMRLYATVVADDGSALPYSKRDLRTYIADDHAFAKTHLIDGGWKDQPEPHGPTNYFWLKGGTNPTRKAWQSFGYGSAVWYAHKLAGELTADGAAIADRYTATLAGLLTERDVCPDDRTCWQRWGSGNLFNGMTLSRVDNTWAGIAAEIDRQLPNPDWNRCYELGGLSALRAGGFAGIVSPETAWTKALRMGANPPDGQRQKLVTLDAGGNPNVADMDNWYGTCRWFYVTEKPTYTAPARDPASTTRPVPIDARTFTTPPAPARKPADTSVPAPTGKQTDTPTSAPAGKPTYSAPAAPTGETVLEQVSNGTGAGWNGSGAMASNEARRVGGSTPETLSGQGVLAGQMHWGETATYDDVNTTDPARGVIDTLWEGICEGIYRNLSSADKADWDAGTKFHGPYRTCQGMAGYQTGQAWLVEAWVGWAWDAASKKAYWIGGGHRNGADSSVYSVDFNATDVADFFGRETQPTAGPSIDGSSDPIDSGEPWSGNSSPSIHSYDALTWMPTVGKMIVNGGAESTGSVKGFGDWYFVWTPGSKGVGDQGFEAYRDNIDILRNEFAGSAWVPGLDVVLYKNKKIATYDPATNRWSRAQQAPGSVGQTLACAPASAFPTSDQPLCISIAATPVSQGGRGLSVYSFDRSSPPRPSHNYCIEAMPVDPEIDWNQTGIAWDGDRREFVFWNGESKMASLPARAIDGCHNTGRMYRHTGATSAALFTLHTLTGDYVPSFANCASMRHGLVYGKFSYAGDGLLVGMNCAADGAWVFKR